jgi:hypothetical protein
MAFIGIAAVGFLIHPDGHIELADSHQAAELTKLQRRRVAERSQS